DRFESLTIAAPPSWIIRGVRGKARCAGAELATARALRAHLSAPPARSGGVGRRDAALRGLRHSGARAPAREPEIHTHRAVVMDSGPRRCRGSAGMTTDEIPVHGPDFKSGNLGRRVCLSRSALRCERGRLAERLRHPADWGDLL